MIINTIGSGGGGVKLPPMSNPVPADKVPEGFETIGQDGTIVNGTLPAIAPDSVDITMDDATGVVTANIPNGYVDTDGITTTFDVPIVDVATPTLSINENGLVTANVVQAKGWVKEVTSASGTMQLQVRTNDDLVVGSDGTVTAPAGYYPQAAEAVAAIEPEITISTSGLITAKAGDMEVTHQIVNTDSAYSYMYGGYALSPGNIRSGVNIFGVTGTVTGGVVTTVTVTTGVAGAVVTAKCGNTTQTATCNNSGIATVNLTMAGVWTISAAHPTNGAYSTQDASVTVQNNFPISLTVGSSTTVSATGQYTATLNMAYRPGHGGLISGTGGFSMAYSVSGVYRYTSSNQPSGWWYELHFCGGAKSESLTDYTWNSGGSTYTTGSIYYNRYPGSSDKPYYNAGGRLGAYSSSYAAGGTMKLADSVYVPFYSGGHLHSSNVESNGGSYYSKQFKIYSISNTAITAPELSIGRAWHTSAGYNNVKCVIIAGGKTSDSAVTNSVEIIESTITTISNGQSYSLTRTTGTALSVSRSHLSSITHTNDYIIIAGGKDAGESPKANVDAFSNTKVKTTPTALSVARYNMATAIAGDVYALFAGGISGNGVSAVIDAYNLSRTRTTPCTLSTARHLSTGITVGTYAIFAGGRTAISSGATDIVDMFDANLTRSTLLLKKARYAAAGCSGIFNSYYVGVVNGGLNATGGALSGSAEYFSMQM